MLMNVEHVLLAKPDSGFASTALPTDRRGPRPPLQQFAEPCVEHLGISPRQEDLDLLLRLVIVPISIL